jgi:ribosomal protein S18 acetylase RimI-like enzyme
VYLLNDRRERSWPLYRFDYWRWHGVENLAHGRLEDVVLWHDAHGRLAAVLNQEGPGEAFFQVHPHHRSTELEEEMLAAAEERLSQSLTDGRSRLTVWANEHDALRRELLAARGYVRQEWAEVQRRQALDSSALSLPISQFPPPPGYTVRALGDGLELLERCYASGLAFHPDDIQYALDNRDDPTWYRNIQNAPLYRRDLDLVATAPDGAVAAFCTIWFDDVARTGAFEPVGTVPAHQRRGLGKAVMAEGLRRLKRMGATLAQVSSYSAEAHALYAAMGFTDSERSEPWSKEWA